MEKLIVEDMSVMTDFEIHQFCLTTPSIRKFALEKTCVLNSGKFKMLDTLLPDIKAQVRKQTQDTHVFGSLFHAAFSQLPRTPHTILEN